MMHLYAQILPYLVVHLFNSIVYLIYYSFLQRKHEFYSAEQDILLQAVQIIKNHGVALGNTWNDAK
jgi:hypothetical protein